MGKNSKHPHEGREQDTPEIAVQCIGVLNQPIEKKINGVQTGKEKNQSIPICIWYDFMNKKPLHSTRKFLELKSTCSEVAGSKINKPKSVAFQFTTDNYTEKEITEIIP